MGAGNVTFQLILAHKLTTTGRTNHRRLCVVCANVGVQVALVRQLLATLAAAVQLLFGRMAELVVRLEVNDTGERLLAHVTNAQLDLTRHLVDVRPKVFPLAELLLTLAAGFGIFAVVLVTMAQQRFAVEKSFFAQCAHEGFLALKNRKSVQV
jgi:hypothetical protein